MLSQPSMMHLIEQVKDEMKSKGIHLRVDLVPTLHDLFPRLGGLDAPEITSPLYPAPEIPHKLDDVAMYFHSSGSTGYPKSIPIKVVQTAQWMRHSMCYNSLLPPLSCILNL